MSRPPLIASAALHFDLVSLCPIRAHLRARSRRRAAGAWVWLCRRGVASPAGCGFSDGVRLHLLPDGGRHPSPVAATAAPLPLRAAAGFSETWLAISCPSSADAACDGEDGELGAGSRLFLRGTRRALGRGSWWHDAARATLYVRPSAASSAGDDAGLGSAAAPPADVRVPVAGARLVTLEGARDVALEALGFTDADYAHDGWQEGFNAEVTIDDVKKRQPNASRLGTDTH